MMHAKKGVLHLCGAPLSSTQFSKIKAASKRVQSYAGMNYAEREQARNAVSKLKIIMKARRTKAIIMAIATATGASVAQTNAAARAAMHEMQQEFGKGQVYGINYTWNPFDGLIA